MTNATTVQVSDSRRLAEVVLGMDLVTPRGLAARRLARSVLGIAECGNAGAEVVARGGMSGTQVAAEAGPSASSLSEQVTVQVVEYVQGYMFEGEGGAERTTEREHTMILDAIFGLLDSEELVDALLAHRTAVRQELQGLTRATPAGESDNDRKH